MRSGAVRLPLAGIAFLALADTAIVVLALPPILRELDTDVAGVAAVLGVYAVVLALALPVAEAIRARAGTRLVGLAGVALFAGGSLVCGLADTLDVLLVARGVQALGGAALLVTAYALLSLDDAGPRLWALAALLGTAAGPAIGGALTQALGWRSIFLFQAPAALLAVPACLVAGPRPAPAAAPEGPVPPAEPSLEQARAARRARRERHSVESDTRAPGTWGVGRVLALGLLSGAIAAALFLTVLLLITGWGNEPLEAALVVSVMPVAALAAQAIPGPAAVKAAGGSLLVAAGGAALAFLPTADAGWTIPPQIAIGAGMGLALPALAGGLLPERSGRDAAALLSVRHLGIALALLILAPIAQSELDTTLAETRERGAAVILDAPIDPRIKLDIAPNLADSVETENPRGGMRAVFRQGREDVDDDELGAYRALAHRADEVLVAAVNNSFRTAYLVGAGLALLAALLLAPRVFAGQAGPAQALRAGLAVLAVAASAAAVAIYIAAADRERPEEVVIQDPCDDRDTPDSGGITGFLQDAALVGLDEVACRAGSSREELVLAMVDEDAAADYEREYDVDPRSLRDLAETALPF